MSDNIETDATKANLASLTKIPAAEFEKHFHEWMERDDVARGLQAKLRSDLIKNFNKTNLGKQLAAHSISATRGSTYRLTPLVLALNTLVAEFLYAQDSHFTLSVFCTEVPFRNTLPDFECMRHFRFNECEIREIWDAVTNSSPTKRCLDPAMLDDYVSNPSSSLLLLFIRCLVNQKPQEMFRKSIEVQTEPNETFQARHHCSTSVQVSPPPPVKSQAKNYDTISHLNKYLVILSQKVNEMTNEFELLVRERNVPRPQRTSRRSARSRDFDTLNRSLERINANVKELTESKSTSKRFANIVESIDGLTKQFAKCAENFYEVTRELCNKEEKISIGQQVNFRQGSERQENKMEVAEKSYGDWINEMRTTNNGQKFLERIEKSIQKANHKYKEHLEAEAESKLKHMKSLMKMHYKQKMILRLSEQGANDQQHPAQAGKLNDDIEIRLKHFEEKQMELMQQLKDSSIELHEAQKRLVHEKKEKQEDRTKEQAQTRTSLKQKKEISIMAKKHEHGDKHMQEVHQNHYTLKDSDAEQMIKETKLRLQQLENESNFVEQNFLTCLKRRKQQLEAHQEFSHKLISQSRRKTSQILENLKKPPALTESTSGGKSNLCSPNTDDLNDEYLKLKEKLPKSQLELTTARSPVSPPPSPTMMSNAIVDAKKKFFEDQNRRRQQREQELARHTVDLEENSDFSNENEPEDQDELNQVSYELSTYSWNFIVPGTQGDFERPVGIGQFQTEDLTLKIGMMNHALDDGPTSIQSSRQPNKYIETPREQMDFGKGLNIPTSSTQLSEQITSPKETLTQVLNDMKSYADNLELGKETTSDLLKQSMAKMKELFADSENTKRTKVITFADESEERLHNDHHQQHVQQRNLDTILDTITTTTVSNTTTTVTSTASHASIDLKSNISYTILQSFPISDTKPNVAGNFITKKQLERNTCVSTPRPPTLSAKGYNASDIYKSANLTERLSCISMPSLLNVTTSDSDEDSIKTLAEEQPHSAKEDDNTDDDYDAEEEEYQHEDEHEHEHEDDNESEEYYDEGENEKKSQRMENLENNVDGPGLVSSPKGDSLEVGEVVSESQFHFASVPDANITSESSSRSTNYEMDVLLEKRYEEMVKGKTSDESENDFWA